MSMLNTNQKQQVDQMKGLNKEEQAQKIADVCNQSGITKEQLQTIIDNLR